MLATAGAPVASAVSGDNAAIMEDMEGSTASSYKEAGSMDILDIMEAGSTTDTEAGLIM
jgi:hypothetical protein